MIDITGANLIEVAKIAYELSKPQGLGRLHFIPGPLDHETARKLFKTYEKKSNNCT